MPKYDTSNFYVLLYLLDYLVKLFLVNKVTALVCKVNTETYKHLKHCEVNTYYIYNIYLCVCVCVCVCVCMCVCVCVRVVFWGIYLILKLLDDTVVLNRALHPE